MTSPKPQFNKQQVCTLAALSCRPEAHSSPVPVSRRLFLVFHILLLYPHKGLFVQTKQAGTPICYVFPR